VKVYHRTYHSDAILRDGFRDGYYILAGIGELRGIFVSAPWPLDENEGADGDVVLEVDVPEELFVEYEWVQDIGYREAMIPAAKLNRCPVRVLDDDEIDELTVGALGFVSRAQCVSRSGRGSTPNALVGVRLLRGRRRRSRAHEARSRRGARGGPAEARRRSGRPLPLPPRAVRAPKLTVQTRTVRTPVRTSAQETPSFAGVSESRRAHSLVSPARG
jgi:hypothetical protein